MTSIEALFSPMYLKTTLATFPVAFVFALLFALVPSVIAVLFMRSISKTFRRVLMVIVACAVTALLSAPIFKEPSAPGLVVVALYLAGAASGTWVSTLLLLIRRADRTAEP